MAAEDIGALVVRIEANLKNFEGNMNKATKRVDGFGSTVKKIGGLIAGAFAVKAIVNFGKTMVTAASDAKEMQSKFNTVFGEMSESTEEWAKNFRDAVGGSKVEIKSMLADSADLLAGFGATEKQSFDLSTKIQSLGTDIASFSNIQGGAEEAVTKLRKGLMGETENLKSLGIVINQKMLQDELMEKGDKRKLKDLTELEKMELRYTIAVRQSALAVGDAEKTSGGFANQMRNLKGQIKDATAQLGMNLLPIATQVVTFLNNNIPIMQMFFENAFAKIKEVIMPIYETVMPLLQEGFRMFIEDILPLFSGKITEISETILPLIVNAFKNLYEKIMPPLQRIFEVFITKILPKFADAYMNFVKNVYPIIIEAFNYIVNNLLPPLIEIFEYIATEIVPLLAAKFQEWIPVIIEIMKGLWDVIKIVIDNIVKAFNFAFPFIKKAVEIAIDSISGTIDRLLKILKGIIDFVVGVFTGDWERAWDGIMQIFSGIWDSMKAIVKGAINGVILLINLGIKALNKFKINVPDWITEMTGIKDFSLNLKEIPKLAKGVRNFRGGTAIVGEKGPELVTLAKGTNVTPAGQTQDMLSDMGNINIETMIVRNDNDIKLIAREIYNLQSQRRRGKGVVPA